MKNNDRRNRVRKRYRAKEREDEAQLPLPTTDDMLVRAEGKLDWYLDDLEAHVRALRNGKAGDYKYALETAQVAIRTSAQVAAIDDIKDARRAA